MSDKPLIQRMLIKPAHRVVLLHIPESVASHFAQLPQGATLTSEPASADVAVLFVHNAADLQEHAATVLGAVKSGGVVWICYPKKSGAIKTDITRDHGWEPIHAAGWDGVTQISVDETWSALRFRPVSEIKVMTRKFGPNAQKA